MKTLLILSLLLVTSLLLFQMYLRLVSDTSYQLFKRKNEIIVNENGGHQQMDQTPND